ncbi:MAG: hypothetical protein H6706_20045 [Myxococcales bacterium]|nr:hypothetical protein [Myxococcales bacterium]
MLAFFSLDELKARAEQIWGVEIDAVAYPLYTISGCTFETPIARLSHWVEETNGSSLPDVADWCKKNSVGLVLTCNLDFAFLNSDLCHIVFARGSTANHACIFSKATHTLFAMLLDGALKAVADRGVEVEGIALSVVDLWGMSGRRGTVETSCYCRECRRSLVESGVDLDYLMFADPSPFRLMLADRNSGVYHESGFDEHVSPDVIIALSERGGLLADEVLKDTTDQVRLKEVQKLRSAATHLIKYIHARRKITLDGLQRLSDAVRAKGVQCFASAQIFDYDWNCGIFSTDLFNTGLFDEVWHAPQNKVDLPSEPPGRIYMVMRGNYYIYALFTRMEIYHDRDHRERTGQDDDGAAAARVIEASRSLQAAQCTPAAVHVQRQMDPSTPLVISAVDSDLIHMLIEDYRVLADRATEHIRAAQAASAGLSEMLRRMMGGGATE